MINTTEGITHLLQGTFLEEKTIQKLSIDDSDEVAFALEIDSAQSLDAWKYHYRTILQFVVGKSPVKPEEAFELAWEQVAIAPWMVEAEGVSLRTHAQFLIAANRINRWFLHEKP
jgi:hypothetical protein